MTDFDRYVAGADDCRGAAGRPGPGTRFPTGWPRCGPPVTRARNGTGRRTPGWPARSALPDPGLYDALYDRHMSPAAWRPYPDAAEVLGALRTSGARVGVVSNIGWDLRPVFRAHGLDALVDAYVLSYEHGIQKPDPQLFHIACTLVGQDPDGCGDGR